MCPWGSNNGFAEVSEVFKVPSSFEDFFVISDLCWHEDEVEGELQTAAVAALLFMRVVIVELLADFSTPPDTNDVFDDETEIGHC